MKFSYLVSVFLFSLFLVLPVTADEDLFMQPFDGCPQVISEDNLQSWEEAKASPPFSPGVMWSLYDITPAVQIGSQTYSVEADKPLNANFRMYYHAEPDKATIPLRFIALINGEQLPDTIFQDTTTIDLEPTDDVVIPIQLPALETGIYDLIIVALNQENSEGTTPYFAYRSTLLAGDNLTISDSDIYSEVPADAVRSNELDQTVYNISLHTEQSMYVWNGPDFYLPVENPELRYYIGLGYTEVQRDINYQSFALVALLDYQQVRINDEHMTFYGRFSPNNLYSYIPATLDIEDMNDQHILQIMRINYPSIPLCLLRDERGNFYLDEGIYIESVGVEIIN